MLCVLFICVFLWEIERTLSMRWDACNSLGRFFSYAGEFFLSQNPQIKQNFSTNVSSSQDSGPFPIPSPAGRSVICEVTPIGLLTRVVGKFSRTEDIIFSHRTHRFNRTFCAQFWPHRRPPAYRIHRTFQLKMAVRFCEIGWLNVSVECCVFCSSV